jgi:hypothetical protein
MTSTTLPPEQRKKILRVLFVSLLLDLVRLTSNSVLIDTANQLTDILYLHPTTLPLPTHFLPLP